MNPPLVTTIDDGPPQGGRGDGGGAGGGGGQGGGGEPQPTILILFNERTGPSQVAEIIGLRHSFIESEVWETVDEQDRQAFLLALNCETATADQLFELIGSRLPDYIQARRFPPSRLAEVRRTGTRLG
jgi:hypothetical protein